MIWNFLVWISSKEVFPIIEISRKNFFVKFEKESSEDIWSEKNRGTFLCKTLEVSKISKRNSQKFGKISSIILSQGNSASKISRICQKKNPQIPPRIFQRKVSRVLLDQKMPRSFQKNLIHEEFFYSLETSRIFFAPFSSFLEISKGIFFGDFQTRDFQSILSPDPRKG